MKVAMLTPLGCDTVADVAAFLSVRCRESGENAGLGIAKALRPGQRDRTGRIPSD